MTWLGRTLLLGALALGGTGCYLSDDEGGRTRRQMNEEFESSTGGELHGEPEACADPEDPACSGVEPARCGGGYPDCPGGGRCVDDPARGCRVGSDPTCPGVCE